MPGWRVEVASERIGGTAVSPWELIVYMLAFSAGLFVNGIVVALIAGMVRGAVSGPSGREKRNAARII